ncbi:MAG: LuxR C-terminal-related transcriptional regulator [Candidatus Dormibacterales bacterium]
MRKENAREVVGDTGNRPYQPILGFDLGKALSKTGDGMVAVDSRHRVVAWNDAATHLLGYRAQEVEGRPCCSVCAWSDPHGNPVCGPTCLAAAATKDQKVVEGQQVLGTGSVGTRIWLEVTTVVLPPELHQEAVLVHFFREAALVRLAQAAMPRQESARVSDSRETTLTPREREVVTLLADGASTQTIAAQLCISTTTVRNHVEHALNKLDVHSRAAAVARLLKR